MKVTQIKITMGQFKTMIIEKSRHYEKEGLLVVDKDWVSTDYIAEAIKISSTETRRMVNEADPGFTIFKERLDWKVPRDEADEFIAFIATLSRDD